MQKKKVKEEISEEELKQLKAGEKQVVIVKAGWVILRKYTGVLKCRLVAKQINPGTHPDQFYSPTPRQTAHRLVMHQATRHDWPLWLGDVSTAFLHAKLDEESEIIIVEPPDTEQKTDQPKIYWRMRKAMYGLRTAPLSLTNFSQELWQARAGRD